MNAPCIESHVMRRGDGKESVCEARVFEFKSSWRKIFFSCDRDPSVPVVPGFSPGTKGG